MAQGGWWRDDDGLLPIRRLGPVSAGALLLVVLALLGLGVSLSLPHAASHSAPRPGGTDARLYTAIIADVARGEPYYAAAVREHRAVGAPLRPFLAVRPPLLAESLARLPGSGARRAAAGALAVAVFLAWAWRLRALRVGRARYAWGLALLAGGLALALSDGAYLFHETWAGLLIALALAVRRPHAWALSVALGLLAALLRELALPFLLAMAAVALVEGRRREAFAWAAALVLAAVGLAAHARMVMSVTAPGDLASPGWTQFAGWAFILKLGQLNAFLLSAPRLAPAVLLPPALLGLLVWRAGDLGRRVGLVVLGYVAAFCVIGRMDNDYWGLLLAPLWPLGLLQVDRAAVALVSRSATMLQLCNRESGLKPGRVPPPA